MRYAGVVIHGDGEGRRLGYPTANIMIPESVAGIYAGTVAIGNATYPAAVFASLRRPILEAHIIDFDADLYGQEIVIEVLYKIRDDRAFGSVAELMHRIGEDVRDVREYFRVQRCSPES